MHCSLPIWRLWLDEGEKAHRTRVVLNDIAALHIHPRDVGHQPVQKVAVLWRVRTGRIWIHLGLHMLCHPP